MQSESVKLVREVKELALMIQLEAIEKDPDVHGSASLDSLLFTQ